MFINHLQGLMGTRAETNTQLLSGARNSKYKTHREVLVMSASKISAAATKYVIKVGGLLVSEKSNPTGCRSLTAGMVTATLTVFF